MKILLSILDLLDGWMMQLSNWLKLLTEYVCDNDLIIIIINIITGEFCFQRRQIKVSIVAWIMWADIKKPRQGNENF